MNWDVSKESTRAGTYRSAWTQAERYGSTWESTVTSITAMR